VTVEGFSTVYKAPKVGTDFTALLDRISKVDPNMRIRFTSPHPKDFKDDLLHLIAERPNISNCIHVPAQSGSSSVLERMRRGYTRTAYLDLIKRAREIIPGIALSSDFIAGFCEETEEEHQETLTLMKEVEFDDAFMFAYSLREKTPAHRKFKDDVPEEVKQRRLREIVDLFYTTQAKKNQKEIGSIQLVLVEGTSKRSDEELKGRTDSNKKVLIPREFDLPIYNEDGVRDGIRKMEPGDYVVVELTSCTGVTFKGKPLAITSLSSWTLHNLGSKIDFRIAIDTPKLKESLC
jgi:MiaB/RimO family radical SAM methylthiotransferase